MVKCDILVWWGRLAESEPGILMGLSLSYEITTNFPLNSPIYDSNLSTVKRIILYGRHLKNGFSYGSEKYYLGSNLP